MAALSVKRTVDGKLPPAILRKLSRGVLFAIQLGSTSEHTAPCSASVGTSAGFQYHFEYSSASVVTAIDRKQSLEATLSQLRQAHAEIAYKTLRDADRKAAVLGPVDINQVKAFVNTGVLMSMQEMLLQLAAQSQNLRSARIEKMRRERAIVWQGLRALTLPGGGAALVGTITRLIHPHVVKQHQQHQQHVMDHSFAHTTGRARKSSHNSNMLTRVQSCASGIGRKTSSDRLQGALTRGSSVATGIGHGRKSSKVKLSSSAHFGAR